MAQNEPIDNNVLRNQIYPNVQLDIKNAIIEQTWWNRGTICFTILKHLFNSISIIFVFIASSNVLLQYQSLFALIGGFAHVLAIVFDQSSVFCSTVSEQKFNQRNALLKSIGINYTEPDTNMIVTTNSNS